jgi:hypothetical protein
MPSPWPTSTKASVTVPPPEALVDAAVFAGFGLAVGVFAGLALCVGVALAAGSAALCVPALPPQLARSADSRRATSRARR